MINLENSVVINRPVDEVFAFLANPENEPLWNQSTQKAEQTSEGPMGVGATVNTVNRFLGRTIDSTWEVTEYEVNRRRAVKSTSGPMPFEFAQTFESVEGGTKITGTGQIEAGGFFKLAEPVVGRMARRQQETSFANLKDFLEAQE
jgi:carbon monoxide dehydrogenase subunit G